MSWLSFSHIYTRQAWYFFYFLNQAHLVASSLPAVNLGSIYMNPQCWIREVRVFQLSLITGVGGHYHNFDILTTAKPWMNRSLEVIEKTQVPPQVRDRFACQAKLMIFYNESKSRVSDHTWVWVVTIEVLFCQAMVGDFETASESNNRLPRTTASFMIALQVFRPLEPKVGTWPLYKS